MAAGPVRGSEGVILLIVAAEFELVGTHVAGEAARVLIALGGVVDRGPEDVSEAPRHDARGAGGSEAWRAGPRMLAGRRIGHPDQGYILRSRVEPVFVAAVLQRQDAERTEELVQSAGIVGPADVPAPEVGIRVEAGRHVDRPRVDLRVRESRGDDRRALGDVEGELAGPEVRDDMLV